MFTANSNDMQHENLIDSNVTSGKHASYWTASTSPIITAPLGENLTTDVVIIGGGMAGISTAYNLIKAGKKVVLVEDGFIGSGETGRTTAHITAALDDRYYEIERMFGEDGARLAADSHSKAIDFIENAVQELNIDCDFIRLDGYLFLDPSDKKENLDKEFEALKRAGLPVEIVTEVPHLKKSVGRAIKYKNQAQFHPLKYLQALSDAIISGGGKIYTETRATDIDHEGITTDKGFTVKAAHVVVATNSPANNMFVIHTKQYPYRSYVIGATIKKGTIPAALWWDTGNHKESKDMPPYHYVRVQSHNETHDVLIVGGEDHLTGFAHEEGKPEEDRYNKLEDWAREIYDIEEVVYRWSGQVMEPMDCLAYIGRNPMDKDNVYVVTGDSGNGMTHTTIAGILLTDLITGKENPWEKLYSPSRFKVFAAGGVFIRELFGMVKEYIKSYPSRADEIKLKDIERGHAEIVELEKDKYGVYRDEQDHLHVVSATCTHLGCLVSWNSDEKSWDCPCHGSRFTHKGKVVNGPAISDLNYYEETDTSFANKEYVS